MLVRFHSDAGSVLMFGDIAVSLLKMMGQSGVLPGALLARDVPAALARLKRAVEGAKPGEAQRAGDDVEPKVMLRQRAFPLIELLARCVAHECDVIWEEQR